MQIDKETILSLLRAQGKVQEAGEAEEQLPPQLDTHRDAALLERFGIRPELLLRGSPGLRDTLEL